jgi:hypothetical protein
MPAYQGEIEKAVLDLLSEDTDADGVVAADELVSGLAGGAGPPLVSGPKAPPRVSR